VKILTLQRLPQPTSYSYQIDHALVSGELFVSSDFVLNNEACMSSTGIVELPRVFGGTIEYRGSSRWKLSEETQRPEYFVETTELISRGDFKRTVVRQNNSYVVTTSTAKAGQRVESTASLVAGLNPLEAQSLFFLGPTLADLAVGRGTQDEEVALDVLVGSHLYRVIAEGRVQAGTSNLRMRMKEVLPHASPLVRDLALVVNLGTGAIDHIEVRVRPPFGSVRFKLIK
jgi:hypothetical protein